MFDICDSRNALDENFVDMEIINLFDESDYRRENANHIKCPEGVLVVAMHGDEENTAAIIFDEFDHIQAVRIYSTEDLIIEIENSGLWHGEPIMLAACKTGARDDGPAARLATALPATVYAPVENFKCNDHGDYYVSNIPLDRDDVRRSYEYQREYMWREF